MKTLLLSSPLNGFFALVFLFLLSAFLVIICKITYFYLKNITLNKTKNNKKEVKEPKKRSKVKNIIINPNEINRIFVKKD